MGMFVQYLAAKLGMSIHCVMTYERCSLCVSSNAVLPRSFTFPAYGNAVDRVGIVVERDLAQQCRRSYEPRLNIVLWIM